MNNQVWVVRSSRCHYDEPGCVQGVFTSEGAAFKYMKKLQAAEYAKVNGPRRPTQSSYLERDIEVEGPFVIDCDTEPLRTSEGDSK